MTLDVFALLIQLLPFVIAFHRAFVPVKVYSVSFLSELKVWVVAVFESDFLDEENSSGMQETSSEANSSLVGFIQDRTTFPSPICANQFFCKYVRPCDIAEIVAIVGHVPLNGLLEKLVSPSITTVPSYLYFVHIEVVSSYSKVTDVP